MKVLSIKFMTESVRKKLGIGIKLFLKGSVILCLFFVNDSFIFCKVDKVWL